jgi:Flp pilus assembly protein TadD
MEQSDVSVELRIAMPVLGRGLSAEVRASLEAVRVARADAHLRARRQTFKARLWFATVVGALALVGAVYGPRLARGRHARRQAPPSTAVAMAATSSTPAEAVKADVAGARAGKLEASPADSDRSAPNPEPSASKPAPSSGAAVIERALVATPASASDAGVAYAGCDTGLIRRAPWRLSASACAHAFESTGSTNATLALAIAHAEHAHGSATAAAGWAERALALDPTVAEAYVLIARADLKDGRDADARTAYRRYLDLAPRGWHQGEARDALRAARPMSPADSAPATGR